MKNIFEQTPTIETKPDPYNIAEVEIDDLVNNPPEGYTVDDFNNENPHNPLHTGNNPVGVEYTLTFGTGMGKAYTHSPSPKYDLMLSKLRSEENYDTAREQQLITEQERYAKMLDEYHSLTHLINAHLYNEDITMARKAIAQLRLFRKRHSWVYEDARKKRENERMPKRKFKIKKDETQ